MYNSDYRYEYHKEECKKCRRCNQWIDTELLVYKGIYFHSQCFYNLQKSLSPSFFDFRFSKIIS